jgi:hypothetical protein
MAICSAGTPKVDKHRRQQEQAGGRNAGRADRYSRGGDRDQHIIGEGQLIAEGLGGEERQNAQIQSRAVHIDGRAQRQHGAGDRFFDAEIFLRVGDGHRQGGAGAGGGEGHGDGVEHAAEEIHHRQVQDKADDAAIDQDGVGQKAQIDRADQRSDGQAARRRLASAVV